jgi:hypothetical protein
MTSVQAWGNITETFGAPQPPDTTSWETGLKGISLLAVNDDCRRENLCPVAETSFPEARVARALEGGKRKHVFSVSFSTGRSKDEPANGALISAALSSDGWYQ